MPYYPITEPGSERSDILSMKAAVDSVLEAKGRAMFQATGVKLADYVTTTVHEQVIVRLGITQYQLMAYVKPVQIPAPARLWLKSNLASRRQAELIAVIVTGA